MSYYSYYNFKRRKIMLVYDFRTIGNKLLAIRKKAGLTQSEVADAANLSDRTYADIERGTVNMRIETILKICGALHITPDAVLTDDNPNLAAKQAELLEQLDHCTVQQKRPLSNYCPYISGQQTGRPYNAIRIQIKKPSHDHKIMRWFYHIKRIRLLLFPENQHFLHKLVDKLQIPERLQYRIYLHHATGNVVVLDLFKALCHVTQIIKAVRTENKFRTCFLNGLLEIFLVDPLFRQALHNNIGIVKIITDNAQHLCVFLRCKVHGKTFDHEKHFSSYSDLFRP